MILYFACKYLSKFYVCYKNAQRKLLENMETKDASQILT